LDGLGRSIGEPLHRPPDRFQVEITKVLIVGQCQAGLRGLRGHALARRREPRALTAMTGPVNAAVIVTVTAAGIRNARRRVRRGRGLEAAGPPAHETSRRRRDADTLGGQG